MQDALNQDSWAEATATKTVNLEQMDALINESIKLWDDYEAKKAISSLAYEEYGKKEAQILQALKDAGKKSYKVDGVATVTITQKASVTVPKGLDEKRKFFEHLYELGEEVYLSMATVNSATLNSWYSEKLEQFASEGKIGFQVPGISDPTVRETLSVRSDKKGKKQ